MSNLHYLSEYSMFKSTAELNESINEHIQRNRYELNETDRTVLITLSQYAVKYNGVAHLKIETIADIIGKSESTARRAIRKLSKLNIIKSQTFMRRVSGGNGANLYIILPYDDSPQVKGRDQSDKPTQATNEADNSENEPISSVSNKGIKETSYKPFKRPYSRFKDAIQTFIGNRDKRLIYRLYGVYLAQTKALRLAYEPCELMDMAIDAIRATFQATKRKRIRNIAGYFNGVISNKIDDMYIDLIAGLIAD